MASSPGRRSERRSYLFRRESAPFQEAGLADPLAVVGGRRLAETPDPRPRRLFGPEPVIPFDRLSGHRVINAAPAKLLANAPGAVAATEARADVLLGKPLIAQQPLCFERIEHAADRVRAGAARGQSGCKLAARMLATREQPESPRPEIGALLADQASTASPTAWAEPLRLGRSMSRNAVSIAIATSLCSLRNSRTLSRPWPMRSPP